MGGGERTDDGHLVWSCGIFTAGCGHKTKRKTEENEQWDKETKFDELHDCRDQSVPVAFLASVGRGKICGLSYPRAEEQCRFDQESLGVVFSNNSLLRKWASGGMGVHWNEAGMLPRQCVPESFNETPSFDGKKD